MNRKAIISMIHMGAGRMGWDEDTRREWMEKHTGKRSCKECSDSDLSRLVDELRLIGALNKGRRASVLGGTGADRPTRNQWKTALGLARDLGMSGDPNDPAFVTFVQRVAKVEHPRFLDRNGMSKVITGLRSWLDGRRAKHENDSGGSTAGRGTQLASADKEK